MITACSRERLRDESQQKQHRPFREIPPPSQHDKLTSILFRRFSTAFSRTVLRVTLEPLGVKQNEGSWKKSESQPAGVEREERQAQDAWGQDRVGDRDTFQVSDEGRRLK